CEDGALVKPRHPPDAARPRRGGDRMTERRREVQNKISPPQISAPGCGRCRAAGYDALGASARLSDPAGAPNRRFGAGGAPDIIARLIGQALSDRLRPSFLTAHPPAPTPPYCP